MKIKVLKTVLIVAMITALTIADFVLLGTGLLTYALEINVEFDSYFKTEQGAKVPQIDYQMDSSEMKLYMKVTVKNDGYFDGVITLEDSNFKLKQEILSESEGIISKIEENVITLNRIQNGKTVEIVVGIEPIIEQAYGADMLSKKSVLKLTGEYKDSTEENISIKEEKNVQLTLLAPTNLETILDAKVMTNKIYKIGEENKRLVQIELDSNVVDNAYPVDSTTFDIALPEGVESVEVITKGTYATNGEAERALKQNEDYTWDKTNNQLQVKIENTSENGKISWEQDATDNIIVTLILPEETEIGEAKYNIKSTVQFYGQEEKVREKQSEYNLAEEADGVIRTSIDNDERIYKGKIYSKEEREYNSTTNIEVNYANLVESATIGEKTVYKVELEAEGLEANVQYKTTIISKSEFDKILGTDGSLVIKDQNGNKVKEVKATDFATEENITITYADGVTGLTIEITKAIAAGIIRLNHTKVIKAESYSREEINAIKYLVEESKLTYGTEEETVGEITELNETETVAELTASSQTLSTATINEDVKFGITLRADGEEYDLYEDPTFTIKLPEGITNVSNIRTVTLNLDDFTNSTSYNSNTREIIVNLHGKQTQYNGINTNGYIEVSANIELDETISSREDQITLTYTNEQVEEYEGSIALPISISGFSGLVAFNRITNYNITTNSVNVTEEQIGSLKMHQEKTEANFEIALVNNTGTDLENITILGNFPVEGNVTAGENTFNNTIAASLKSEIITENGEGAIYYTTNQNATTELSNAENGWTTNLTEVGNPVLYMIVLESMNKQSNFVANYTMSIPANLQYGQEMKTAYTATYATSLGTKTVKSETVGLETGNVIVTLEATVGTEKLENNMTVKAGEVIRYKATVTNTGSSKATNIKLSANVPEGTVYVEPMENFEYATPTSLYYEEDESKKSVEYIVEELKGNETATYEYEVRVKNDITSGTALNKATVTYNEDIEISSEEISNNLENGDLRVTIKRRTDIDVVLNSNQAVQYYIIVKNISNETIENVETKINLPEEITLNTVVNDADRSEIEINNNSMTISTIAAGECNTYLAYMMLEDVLEPSKDVQISVTAELNGTKYRSNAYDETIYGYDVEMQVTATHEGEYLDAGDVVEYNIAITNNSAIETSSHTLKIEIPTQLSIQEIEQDGTQKTVLNKNYLSEILAMDANSTTNIKITAIVNYNPYREEVETVSTTVQVVYLGIEEIATKTIVHYLDSVIEKDPGENPDEPETPADPDDPNTPDNPDTPDNPVNPDEKVNKYKISGKAWIDQNQDGEMNNNDTILSGIQVKLLNAETNEFVRDSDNKKDLIATTGKDGYYLFEDIEEGNYIVVFEYDDTLYKPTTYKKENVGEDKNSNVISKTLKVNGEEKLYAITYEIELKEDISNINLGLVFIKKYDVQLNKYVSKIIVQTSKGTSTYNYQNNNFVKVEIPAKQMPGSLLLIQYTIKVTNIGDVDAYVNSLVDYLPTGLKFSSELNKDWYQVGTDLYTSALENIAIAPGESKEVNLTLTKTMAEGNAELINNMAEIAEAYNIYGIADINSTQANANKDENDLGSADLLIGVQTGTTLNYILLAISMMPIIAVAAYLINKKVLKIKI